jgi:hypothetical protein
MSEIARILRADPVIGVLTSACSNARVTFLKMDFAEELERAALMFG